MADEETPTPAQDTPEAGTDKETEGTTLEGTEPKDEGGEDTKEDEKGTEPKEDDKGSDAPEEYDLKLPEDSQLDPSVTEEIADFAREQGFSNEQAQALLDRESNAVASYIEAQDEQVKEIRESWLGTSEKDKEIGGDGFKENVELAKRAVDKYGSDEFRQALDETGFGNHPEVLRTFVRIGKAMGEDNIVSPGSGTGSKGGKKSFYDKSDMK